MILFILSRSRSHYGEDLFTSFRTGMSDCEDFSGRYTSSFLPRCSDLGFLAAFVHVSSLLVLPRVSWF